jgi:hypothetical protein
MYTMNSIHSIRSLAKVLFVALYSLGITKACYAQSVPSGSILWLRADTGVVTQNGLVAIWHDQSGNGNDARMDDTGSRPELAMDSGRPAIVFRGLNYLEGASVFPVNHDYTVAGVFRLSDTTVVNNIISGNDHAVWLNSSTFLHFHQVGFQVDAIASASSNPNGSSFVAVFDAESSMVRLFIDGRMSDSLWTLENDDSTILIGSYEQSYFLHGSISELLLYDRTLSDSEAGQVDQYFETKYGLAVRPAPPPRDTTFSMIPAPEQFFPRNAQDSASFSVSGIFRTVGFDSIYLETSCNGVLVRRTSLPLIYQSGEAAFSFESAIHSELSEYSILVGVLKGGYDSTLTIRDSLVCGDAFLVSGQSNAFIGFQVEPALNEFCRTFGVDYDHNAKDTQWTAAQSLWPGFYNNICAWSFALAQDLIDSLHIPICIIDGALPGCTIEAQMPDDSNHLDMNTAYGLMLYRTSKAGLQNSMRAIVWDQGEWNTDTNYYNNFTALRTAWLEDYPSLEKIYAVQIRPNACDLFSDQRPLKELQRHFEDSLANVIGFASAALPLHDGCHLGDSGYRVWGMQMYRLFARDLYHSSDTLNIASPNVYSAFYTSPAHDEIELLFSPANVNIALTPDTVIYGSLRKLVDFFYLDDVSGGVQSVRAQGNALFLSVNNPSAHTLTYLPDRYYPDSSGVYEGPWIVNSRGVGAFIWYELPISDQPLSVNEPTTSVPDVEIIPDPASRSISIDASALTGPIEATLVSETGAIVWRNAFPAEHPASLEFDLSNENSGCYLLRLSNASSSIERKFILER